MVVDRTQRRVRRRRLKRKETGKRKRKKKKKKERRKKPQTLTSIGTNIKVNQIPQRHHIRDGFQLISGEGE